MNTINNKRRIFPKRINSFHCKTCRKYHHRKQKGQDIDPTAVLSPDVFSHTLFFYQSHHFFLFCLILFRRILSSARNKQFRLFRWSRYSYFDLPYFYDSVISHRPDYNTLHNVSCFCEITANFFRIKEKTCHIIGDTENSADVTAFFERICVRWSTDPFMGVIINFMWWVFLVPGLYDIGYSHILRWLFTG